MEKKKIVVNLIVVLVIIALTILTIMGTVAFFGWKSEKEAKVDVTIASGSGSCSLRSDNEKFIEPTEDRYGGRIIRLNAKQELGEKALITWNLIVNEINGLEDKTFKYELINYTTGASYGSGTFEGVTSNSEISFSNNNDVLGFNREYMFILYLWIDGTIGNNELTMADQTFNFDMNCNMVATDAGVVENENIMMSVLSTDADAETDTFLRKNEQGEGLLRSEVGSVTFTKNINVPSGNTQIDVSLNEDNSVVMWYGTANSDNKYDVYIGGNNGKVDIPNAEYLFAYLTNVKTIDFANAVDTSNVTSMRKMFNHCEKLTALNLNIFDTSNVTNMLALFQACYELVDLNISGFDTSNVTDMAGIFSLCKSLIKLDISNFNTSNVTTMQAMFQDCNSLTSLDVSTFDTSNVTNMRNMFRSCSTLVRLDLSNFNTQNVTDMTAMFGELNLTELDLSSFDTSKVTTMLSMFNSSRKLTSLNLSSFDTSQVTDMEAMFQCCNNLTILDISNFDTSNVTNMRNMFNECNSLNSLDLSNFNTQNVTNMFQMFVFCSKLKTIYISNLWNITTVIESSYMFSGCTSLIGGTGTTYNSSYTDKTYARVDDPTNGKPGYFTYKEASV